MTSAICWPNCVCCDSENSSVHSYWVLWGNGIIPLQSYNLFVGPIIVSPVSPLLKALCMAASGTLECEWSLVDVWLLADRDDLSGDLKEVLVSVDSPPSEALHFRLKLSLGLISGTSSGPRLCTQNKKQKKIVGMKFASNWKYTLAIYSWAEITINSILPTEQMDSCCGKNKIEWVKG